MARPVTILIIFFLGMNLFAGVMMNQGVDDAIGIDAEVGEDGEYDQAVEDSNNVNTGTGIGSTLFAMYNVLSNQVGNLFNTIFPGLLMLNRAGVPSYITSGIFGPVFSVMIGIGIISFLRGWDL